MANFTDDEVHAISHRMDYGVEVSCPIWHIGPYTEDRDIVPSEGSL